MFVINTIFLFTTPCDEVIFLVEHMTSEKDIQQSYHFLCVCRNVYIVPHLIPNVHISSFVHQYFHHKCVWRREETNDDGLYHEGVSE